jgi:hypothetical protein
MFEQLAEAAYMIVHTRKAEHVPGERLIAGDDWFSEVRRFVQDTNIASQPAALPMQQIA